MLLINNFKAILKKIIKLVYFNFYNIFNDTNIKSSDASIHAKYGYNISIGRNTVIDDNVEIGDYSYVNSNSSVENCLIGKFCSISSGVYICPAEHNLSFVTTHPITNEESKKSKVIIGNDVLISLNVIILEGVSIGNGAVIAAGSVVTKDVKPYEVVGGIPAKHIKFRFNEEKIAHYESIKWWDWDSETINNNLKFLRKESEIN